MISKIRIYSLLMILFIALSCSNDRIDTFANAFSVEKEKNVDYLKSKFSLALAKVLSENKNAREFIKNEALKQFDYDYDVLYMLVKDKTIMDGKSLEMLLLQHMKKNDLYSLIHQIPALTIFVPSLPENIFSAEEWNVEQEVPCVAFKNEKEQILFVDSKGEFKKIRDNEIPAFPIVVVKPSERVVLQSESTRSSGTVLEGENGLNFVFEYNEFNNLTHANIKTRSVGATEIPDSLKKIYDAKKFSDENGIWQRDYIYYNISTKNGKGVFQKNISECLYSFELMGDPNNSFRNLSDQADDPKYYEDAPDSRRPRESSYWYNGNYEFIIRLYVSNNQLTTSEIDKGLSISPYDLFSLDLQHKENGRDTSPMIAVGVKEYKKYYLPEPLQLFDWNIENYSTAIKISIEEKDNKGIIQNVVETTTTFATNFEFDASLGEKKKIGAKFGASSTIQQKISTTVTTNLDSDLLGDVIVNFGDDVVVKNEMDSIGYYVTNGRTTRTTKSSRPGEVRVPIYKPALNPKYKSGYYKIEILPLALY
ncbi:hypothetical protein FQ707_10550 [Bacteroidaceae bacterium HV4-6-C5C]|nr:hypothetical protein FQ707_10550 [Bacteroidaceae bacterium HV4-6-C5C]